MDDYRAWADDLAVLLHPDVADYFAAPPEALTDIDFRLWRTAARYHARPGS